VTLSPRAALLIGVIVAPALFAASAWFTRANARRTCAALASSLVYALANVLLDQLALRQGWWSYPAFTRSNTVWLVYLLSGLVAGGAAALIGWRAARRYGTPGLVIFLLIWSIWGVFHDLAGVAATPGSALMEFAPGAVPVIADGLVYFLCAAAAQLTLALLAGPPSSDPLARSGSR